MTPELIWGPTLDHIVSFGLIVCLYFLIGTYWDSLFDLPSRKSNGLLLSIQKCKNDIVSCFLIKKKKNSENYFFVSYSLSQNKTYILDFESSQAAP